MSIFKIYNCDFGITLNGVNYNFTHVDKLTIEDPEKTRLTRGANAGNKTGLVFHEGTKEAKTITVTILGMTADIFALLKAAHDNDTRMDVFAVSREDGSSKIAKNAVLCQEPKQQTLDDSAESMNVDLIFESFDVSEVHKN
jgi:hypothetical protein